MMQPLSYGFGWVAQILGLQEIKLQFLEERGYGAWRQRDIWFQPKCPDSLVAVSSSAVGAKRPLLGSQDGLRKCLVRRAVRNQLVCGLFPRYHACFYLYPL